MQASGMKTCFQIPECSLFYAKIMQASGMKTCFQIPECSLSYAKLRFSVPFAHNRITLKTTVFTVSALAHDPV